MFVDTSLQSYMVFSFRNNGEVVGSGVVVGVIVGIGFKQSSKDEVIDDVRKIGFPSGRMYIRVDGEAFLIGEM